MSQEPEEKRDRGAEQEAGDDWKIKRGVLAAMDDVAGEPAEAQRKLSAEVQKSANDGEEDAENKERAAKFAKGVHSRILPQVACKSFRNCSHVIYTIYLTIDYYMDILHSLVNPVRLCTGTLNEARYEFAAVNSAFCTKVLPNDPPPFPSPQDGCIACVEFHPGTCDNAGRRGGSRSCVPQ